MRLERLDLHAFGPFTGQVLQLSTESPGGLVVVYGENEAGKSSALRALHVLLFGFPHRAENDFLHDKSALRVGGVLRHSDGSTLALLRRRGKKNTLLDPQTEEPLNPSVLRPYLAGVDRDLFARIYRPSAAGLGEPSPARSRGGPRPGALRRRRWQRPDPRPVARPATPGRRPVQAPCPERRALAGHRRRDGGEQGAQAVPDPPQPHRQAPHRAPGGRGVPRGARAGARRDAAGGAQPGATQERAP